MLIISFKLSTIKSGDTAPHSLLPGGQRSGTTVE